MAFADDKKAKDQGGRYGHQSVCRYIESEGVGPGKAWTVAVVALAALVTTVAWAAPVPGSKASAELTPTGLSHLDRPKGVATLTETLTFEEPITDAYDMSVTLHLRDEKGKDAGPLTIGGREVSVTASVKAEADGKTLRLPVAIDAKDLAGKTVVAFVTLSRDGTDVLRRDDIEDESQTMRFPAITTTFSNGDEGHEVCGDATLRLATDLVYENVLPKREYQAYVTPMDADTGEPLLDDSGNVLTITHKFKIIVPPTVHAEDPSRDGTRPPGGRWAIRSRQAIGGPCDACPRRSHARNA